MKRVLSGPMWMCAPVALPGAARLMPYSFTIQASNGVGAVAKQMFTLLIDQIPAITSANAVQTKRLITRASSL